MERRYTTLRTIGMVFKVLAVIALMIALLLAVLTVAGASIGGRVLTSQSGGYGYDMGGFAAFTGLLALIPILVGGLGSALWLFVVGELLCVLVDLEHNTRSTAALLEYLAKRQRGD